MNSIVQWFSDARAALADTVALGGPVVVLLLVMSIIALTIIIVKIWQFSRWRVRDRRTARAALNIYQGGNIQAAISMANQSANPAAQLVAKAIEGRSRVGLPESMLREELLRFGGDLLESLRAYLRPLEVIASLAPLLGLFGTVLGMIEAFQDLQQAGSQVNPAVLSGGIWQALLTTAVGLAGAMPVIVALNWFERVADRVAHDMDSIVTQVFTADVTRQSTPSYDTDASEQRRAPYF